MPPTTCGDGQKFNCYKEHNEKGEANFFIIGFTGRLSIAQYMHLDSSLLFLMIKQIKNCSNDVNTFCELCACFVIQDNAFPFEKFVSLILGSLDFDLF